MAAPSAAMTKSAFATIMLALLVFLSQPDGMGERFP
jgi:hypothetical protein